MNKLTMEELKELRRNLKQLKDSHNKIKEYAEKGKIDYPFNMLFKDIPFYTKYNNEQILENMINMEG